MAIPTFSQISPFAQYAPQNAATLIAFFENNNVTMPPEDARHFITHCDEFSPQALESLLEQYKNAGCPEGVHQYDLGEDVVTRLHGPRVGNDTLRHQERFLIQRGQGRPPEEVIADDEPFQADTRGVIIQFGGIIWTVHSGPMMPKMEDDPEGLWAENSLAYTSEEIAEKETACYKWVDMGTLGSEQINIATRWDMLKAAEGDEEKVIDVLVETFASVISYKEYCQIRYSSL